MLSDVLGKTPEMLVLDYILDIHTEGFNVDELADAVRIRKTQAARIITRLESFGLIARDEGTEETPRFHENPESKIFQSLMKLDIITLEVSIGKKKGFAYPNASEYGKLGGKPKQKEYVGEQAKKAVTAPEKGGTDGQEKKDAGSD